MKLASQEAYKIVLKHLNERKDDLGLSNYAIAKRSGLSRKQVNEYLTGSVEPSVVNFYQLLGALHIQPRYVFAEDSDFTFQYTHFN